MKTLPRTTLVAPMTRPHRSRTTMTLKKRTQQHFVCRSLAIV
ncbi:hypothetical protein RchiOBHm_Chr2g0133771 [Rosa chinensis]|uniref:Uncharacterized protein n=1 Tax=Rosa chinensis TaxID=74649 RepID=A0A2P6RVM8_ROSCH|nr:hypothetical protein RchiOBHm_Chr2g0133771 [Rosa chinensis]